MSNPLMRCGNIFQKVGGSIKKPGYLIVESLVMQTRGMFQLHGFHRQEDHGENRKRSAARSTVPLDTDKNFHIDGNFKISR